MKLFDKLNRDPWQGELTEQSVYEKNEYSANKTFLLLTVGLFLLSLIMLGFCYFEERTYNIYSSLTGIVSAAVSFLAMAAAFILAVNGSLYKQHMKYWMFFITEITILVLVGVYGFNYTTILFTIPILISNRYPSRRFQTVVSVSSIIMATAMPLVCLWLGQVFKYVFFDHNQINFFEGTVITVDEAFYYSIIEHFDEIDWYSTYLDTFKEASVSCFFMTSLFVFINYLVVNAHRRNLSENETLMNNKLKSERELLLAKSVQESALPEKSFSDYEKFEIAGKMLPSEYVSGDFYDYFPVGEDKICLVVGDVSDHGLPSAMFMMSVRNTLRTVSDILPSPGEIMTRANRILCERNEVNMFATVWLGIFELKSGIITYVNAGHPLPLVKKSGGEIVEVESEANAPLGIFDREIYFEHSYALEKGDVILIYTDGVTEAAGEDGKQYGTDNFKESIKSAGNFENGFLDSIVNELVSYRKSAVFEDDVTLLAGKFEGE